MIKKKPAYLISMALIGLVIFGYLLFFTVYRQMISQNEGFFYVLVFGGVLVLAFILLSLMTKLMAFSREGEDSVVFLILEIVFLLGMAVLCARVRIAYSTSVPAEESVVYRAATLLHKGTLSVGGVDIMPQLFGRPSNFFMAALLSLAFSIAGEDPSLMITVNTLLLIASAFLAYGIVRRLSSRISSLFVFLIVLFMPGMAFCVYNYDAQLLFCCSLFLSVFLTVLPMTAKKRGAASVVAVIFAGIAWGLTLALEPVSILVLAVLLFCGRIGRLSLKMSGLIALIAVFSFFGFSFLFSVAIEQPVMDLMPSFFARFNPFRDDYGQAVPFADVLANFHNKIDAQQKAINDNYYFLTNRNGSTYSSITVAWLQLGNQILYMFMIVLSIACAFYMIRSRNPRILPVLSTIIASFVMMFFSSGNEYNIAFFLVLIIMTGAVSLRYMYENHHALADENMQRYLGVEEEEPAPEETVIETEEDRAAFMARAQALIFVGMNEEFYRQIKDAEAKAREEALAKLPGKRESVPVAEAEEEKKQEEPAAVPLLKKEESAKAEPVAAPVQTEEEKKEKEKEKEIEYLESPLPLPKKHEPKELDYDRVQTPGSKEDDFDFDIDDDDLGDFDDDFDI